MKCNQKGLNFIRSEINNPPAELVKNKTTDFTRKRKIGPKELIVYNLNKKGLSNKMEEYQFFKITGYESISSPGMLKQREKLNPKIFNYLNRGLLNIYYNECKNEMKTYNGYLLTATDGSEFEIPNTKESRKGFGDFTCGPKKTPMVPRAKVSLVIDLLNRYAMDIEISKYRSCEMKLYQKHVKNLKENFSNHKIINIRDRGYASLELMCNDMNKSMKFIQRIDSDSYKKEISQMKSNDEEITINYTYNRMKYHKTKNPEFHKYMMEIKELKVRVLKVILESGETELLLTNLDFKYEEIKELYNLRWGIETVYHQLKENLKIETISSSKQNIIKQEILSQILVNNIVQSFINVSEQEINQENYKHKMKINHNMAIGLLKNNFIYIMLEEDNSKRMTMMDEFEKLIVKYLIPTRPKRKYQRNKFWRNKHHINKRKSF